MSSVQMRAHATAEFRFFIFDALNGEFTYFQSVADRDAVKDGVIQSYLDDGWDESVEQVLAGEITHVCQKIDVQPRPADDQIDGEGNDRDGVYWAPEWEYRCNYDLLPLTAAEGA